MIKLINLFVMVFLTLSCSLTNNILSANKILPRRSYVFVEKTVNLKKCYTDKCTTGKVISVGSGFIVEITHKGAFIMTAAHVCTTDKADLLPEVNSHDVIKVEALDGRWYNTKILKYNRDIDACLMFAEDLTEGVEKVTLSKVAPKEGDKVYNIASPYGVHYPNVVPIFEGRYFGERDYRAFYTFEAAPGSSGSMILNEKGELIGLLHSVYRDMYSIVVSVRYDNLMQFIKHGLIKHSLSHIREIEDYNKYSGYGFKL